MCRRMAASVIVLIFMISIMAFTASSAMAQGIKAGRPDPYNRPIPCLLPTGKCIMQTGEQCDQAQGTKLEGCDNCDDCKKQGKFK